MSTDIRAELGRSCEGCPYVTMELWGKEKHYRCGAEGEKKGYIVGVKRFTPWIPAWCPKRKKDDE